MFLSYFFQTGSRSRGCHANGYGGLWISLELFAQEREGWIMWVVGLGARSWLVESNVDL